MAATQQWHLRPQSFSREYHKEDKQARNRRIEEEAELERLLAEGWEPFAANVEGSYMFYTIWLRKLGER